MILCIWHDNAVPIENQPINTNGPIYSMQRILKFAATSAAEAKLGALYLDAKEVYIMWLILHELGHQQLPTPI